MKDIEQMVEKIKKSSERLVILETPTILNETGLSFFEILTPAMAGGIIIGIMLGVPILNFFLPIVPIGGWFAGKLVNEFYEKRISKNNGAQIGIFAGMIGAFIATLINIIAAFVYSGEASVFVSSFIDYKTSYVLLQLSGLDPYITIEALGIRLIGNLFLGISLGAIGGVIYSKFSQTNENTRK